MTLADQTALDILDAKLALEEELIEPLAIALSTYLSTWEKGEGVVRIIDHVAHREQIEAVLVRHYARVVSVMSGRAPPPSGFAPASMIVGFYLILTGLTRFVEEHHRGEPQTKVHAGLHSYQWLCIAMFAVGAICTCLPSPLALPADAVPPSAWRVSHAVALIYAFAMGVDFPASNRRFSLLVPRT